MKPTIQNPIDRCLKLLAWALGFCLLGMIYLLVIELV